MCQRRPLPRRLRAQRCPVQLLLGLPRLRRLWRLPARQTTPVGVVVKQQRQHARNVAWGLLSVVEVVHGGGGGRQWPLCACELLLVVGQ
jgi:hypothetical protein